MQKAIRVHHWEETGFSGLQVDDVDILHPGPLEVQVNWQLRPLQPDELLALTGQYPVFQPELPAVPGCDGRSNADICMPCLCHVSSCRPGLAGMGIVCAMGEQSTKFKPGQRVAMSNPVTGRPQGNGTFQQYSLVPETSLVSCCCSCRKQLMQLCHLTVCLPTDSNS